MASASYGILRSAVKSLGKFPDSFLEEIAGQPAAMLRAVESVVLARDGIEAVASAAASRPRVVLSGMGASHFAGYPAVTALAANGIAALHVDAAELLHFRLPVLGSDSLLVLTSQSGASAETLALCERLRARAPSEQPFVVTVTNGLDNPLAVLADVGLDTAAGPERGPSTLTFAASLVTLAAVARAIAAGAGGRGDASEAVSRSVGDTVDMAAHAAQRALTDDPVAAATRMEAWLGERPVVVALGRGSARAAAEMGALVLKEAARIPAESLEGAQFRHGPLELAGPDMAAFVVATEPPTAALDRSLAAELARTGAAVFIVEKGAAKTTNGDHSARSRSETLAIGAVDTLLAPAVAVIPMQLLAWALATTRGLDPTELRVAAKVTTRE